MGTPIRRLVAALAGLLALLLLVEAIAVFVFRSGWRPGIDAVRHFNRACLNPLMMRRAGTPGWYASAIHHVGRRSGREYVTPIVAERVGDRFVIPLPYGADVDWSRNVLAAGKADLDADGLRHHLVGPAILEAEEVEPLLSDRWRSRFGFYGVDRYLVARAA